MNSPQLPPDPSPGVIVLPANGTTAAAEELRNQLVCAAELGATTVIDGAAVQTIGQALLQLLVAARRGAMAEGRTCIITGASSALRTVADACCLAEDLGLQTAEAPGL